MKTVYLTPDQVPAFLRGSYTGKKFSARIADSVTLTGTNWEGGSRDRYHFVALDQSHVTRGYGGSDAPAPWNNKAEGQEVPIPAGYVCVEHSIYRGKDLGLTFHINPADMANLLPANDGPELTDKEAAVLCATAGLKSFARREALERGLRASYDAEPVKVTTAEYESIVPVLVERGLLRKNKSITPAGRNAVSDHPLRRGY